MNHESSSTPLRPKQDAPGAEQTIRLRQVTSAELLQGNRELQIEHAGDIYRLRVTKSGKLILTK